jgi:hypothetical protein
MLKRENAESGITEYALRGFCADQKVKTIHSGKKILVNVESLRRYLAEGDQKEK